MMMRIRSNQKGFTLIELVIVVAIIGILAALAVPNFGESSAKARGSKIAADLRTIDSAIQITIANGGTVAAGGVDATDNAALIANLAGIPTPPVGTYIGPRGTTAAVAAAATYSVVAAGTTFRGALGAITADAL